MPTRIASSLAFALLLAAPAAAQFVDVERSFAVVEGRRNLSTLSLPDPAELPDIATSLERDACDLSALPADGVINADDIICRLWGDGDDAQRFGVFTLTRVNPSSCRQESRTAFRAPWDGRARFVGVPFEYEPTMGYYVRVHALPGQPLPENRVILRSRCEIDLPPVVHSRSCPYALLAVPYDIDYRSADELLCGLQGRDWEPNPAREDMPDRCTNGLYDPVSGVSVTVQRWLSDRDWPVGRSAFNAGGAVRFIGTDFELRPTEAAQVNVSHGYLDRVWAPESDPCR